MAAIHVGKLALTGDSSQGQRRPMYEVKCRFPVERGQGNHGGNKKDREVPRCQAHGEGQTGRRAQSPPAERSQSCSQVFWIYRFCRLS